MTGYTFDCENMSAAELAVRIKELRSLCLERGKKEFSNMFSREYYLFSDLYALDPLFAMKDMREIGMSVYDDSDIFPALFFHLRYARNTHHIDELRFIPGEKEIIFVFKGDRYIENVLKKAPGIKEKEVEEPDDYFSVIMFSDDDLPETVQEIEPVFLPVKERLGPVLCEYCFTGKKMDEIPDNVFKEAEVLLARKPDPLKIIFDKEVCYDKDEE